MLLVFAFLLLSRLARAQPASIPFQDCLSGDASQIANSSSRINVSTVYAQLLLDDDQQKRLNFTVIGTSGEEIVESSNVTFLLATLFTTTQVLTFSVWDYGADFCSTLRPPSPLPPVNATVTGTDFCPIAAGPIAFSTTIPIDHGFELASLNTQLRAVDTSSPAVELVCIDVSVTPLSPGTLNSVYGHAAFIFWVTIAIAIVYWVVVGLARISSAWGRGSARYEPGIWSRVKSAGYILASAISGERLTTVPALLRFATPSMRDIVFHTQWCAALAMVAVQWPPFMYPYFVQTAWSILAYNTTITQDDNERWNPLEVPAYNPPSDFADQLDDPSSPIFISRTVPNTLFMLPSDAASGIPSFAYSVGLRPQDMFGICLALFLSIIAGTLVVSAFVWGADRAITLILRPGTNSGVRADSYSPGFSSASKDMIDAVTNGVTNSAVDDNTVNSHLQMPSTNSRTPLFKKSWFKSRLGQSTSSFHGSILHGNLVRILILFHLPVTLFSCYQFTTGRTQASITSVILAALSFAVFSLLLPIFLLVRLYMTPTSKLYAETHTLLALGSLYNRYGQGSQLFACVLFLSNLIFGITIGCGQKSGTAQAIIILVVEVVSALGTSIWLPWGHGAGMGFISFLQCVARIVIAVLLVILSPTVSVGSAAGGWVAYAILLILGMVYIGFILMLFIKVVEATCRIVGGIPFDQSKYTVDSGLLGVLGLLGCCGSRKQRRSRNTRRSASRPPRGDTNSSRQTSVQKRPSPTPYDSHNGPPSVLRPEQASHPYREESDDENGYIMGAWQPFPRPGYSPIHDKFTSPPETTPAPTSGFSRVGGGRAHHESPYTISPEIVQTFPTVEQSVSNSRNRSVDQTPPSHINVVHQTTANLPIGAMPPFHVRTKSQTAIIEDASVLSLPAQTATGGENRESQSEAQRPSAGFMGEEGSLDPQPKRKWFNLRKSPRRSSDGEDGSEGSDTPANQSSFVVIRDRKPPGPSRQEPSGSSRHEPPSSYSDPQTPKSFAVIRATSPTGPSRSNSSSRISTSSLPPSRPARRVSNTT